jgi:hypothetical protein
MELLDATTATELASTRSNEVIRLRPFSVERAGDCLLASCSANNEYRQRDAAWSIYGPTASRMRETATDVCAERMDAEAAADVKWLKLHQCKRIILLLCV